MAKQQFTFNLSQSQICAALQEYAHRMIDGRSYDLALTIPDGIIATFVATKKRARKAKSPKVAAVPKAAA